MGGRRGMGCRRLEMFFLGGGGKGIGNGKK